MTRVALPPSAKGPGTSRSGLGMGADTTIVFLNNYAGAGVGGGEVHLLHLLAACLNARMRVHLICEPGGELAARAAALGVTVVPCRLRKLNVLRMASRVRKYCSRYDAAILHSTGWLTNVIGRLATCGGRPALVNTIHCEPDAPLAEGGSRVALTLRNLVDRLTIGRADAVCPVSGVIAAKIRPLVGDPGRIRVIHNGIDIREIRDAAVLPIGDDVLAAGPPVVGLVGRLVRVKAIDDFLRAAALVAASRSAVRFVVVGEGPERRTLEALAANLGIAQRVTFTGFVPRPEPYLARFDVNVLCSRSEGFGMTLLEAMALGRPNVVTRVGGMPEIVIDGCTGLVTPPSDPAALAEAIGVLLDDPDRAAAMGEAGRLRMLDHFTVDVMQRAYLRLYSSLIAGKG